MTLRPWTSGPKELLQHAVDHLTNGTAFDCRIAMISVDNAVELAIRTYLGLPKRVRGSEGPTRSQLEEKSRSFPDLLDLLERFAADKLDGLSLGDLEGYHRLRNALYHDGNGVTVDPVHVETATSRLRECCCETCSRFLSPNPARHRPTRLLGSWF